MGFVYSADEVLGFTIGSYEGEEAGKDFHLIDLCVRADAQAKGIGSKLLKHLERTLKETNAKSIYLRACADRLATFHACRFSERLNGLLITR